MIISNLNSLKKAIIMSSSSDFREHEVLHIQSEDIQFVIMSCWILQRTISCIRRCQIYGYSVEWCNYLCNNVMISCRNMKFATMSVQCELHARNRTRMATKRISIKHLMSILVPNSDDSINLHYLSNRSVSDLLQAISD